MQVSKTRQRYNLAWPQLAWANEICNSVRCYRLQETNAVAEVEGPVFPPTLEAVGLYDQAYNLLIKHHARNPDLLAMDKWPHVDVEHDMAAMLVAMSNNAVCLRLGQYALTGLNGTWGLILNVYRDREVHGAGG